MPDRAARKGAPAHRGRRCPACGTPGGEAPVHDLALRAPDGHPLEGGYAVVSCARCGCGFADAVVEPSYYARYYAEVAKYAGEAAGSPAGPPQDPPFMTAKADAGAEFLAGFLARTTTPVLDVGCGIGSLLGSLARRGFTNLVGVDPSLASVQIAAARPGVSAYVGGAADVPPSSGRFGCVVLTGVLEHLFEPAATLRAACARLEPGGLVWVVVPDASSYLDPYLAPFEDFNTEHVNHFSLPCLELLGARCGLEVVASRRELAEVASRAPAAHLSVVFRSPRRASGPPVPAVERDGELEQVLRSYAARSAADLARVDAFLDEALGGNEQFALWGVGEAAFRLLCLPSLASRRLAVLADANPARAGLAIGGVRVGPPSALPPGDLPIVVASFLRSGSIRDAAARLGLPNPLVAVDCWRELAVVAQTGPAR
jgi:SAM-dependent methyltransferase